MKILIKKVMKYVFWVCLIFCTIFFAIILLISYFFVSGEESRREIRSIDLGYSWGDHTDMGQVDNFGFNLKDRYETEYLIGMEDGFTSPEEPEKFSIHVYEIKRSDIKSIKRLFKKNKNYHASKNFSPLCQKNRYLEKTITKAEAYKKAYCKENKKFSADCIVLSGDNDHYENKICLFSRYLEFSWKKM